MIATTAIANFDERARTVIGRHREELCTPALVLDLETARANIETMAARVRDMPVELRPHIKVHKSPELALLQIEAGAIGVSAATAWEAVAMARAGVPNILVANEVVGDPKIAALLEAARHTAVSVAVDDADNLRELAGAAEGTSVELGVLIDVDTGMGRCGVRSAQEAVNLARVASGLGGVRLLGVSGYEGHCMLEPNRERRAREAGSAIDLLLSVVDELADDGHHCEVVSAGGTGTYDITGLNPRVTELQAGSYVVMDAFHATLVDGFDVALTVQASVISRHGQVVILDAGRKAVGADLTLPRTAFVAGETLFTHEEHTGVRVESDSTLRVGDRVELLSGYAPATVNLYDVMHVLEKDIVIDLWPVHARYGSATLG